MPIVTSIIVQGEVTAKHGIHKKRKPASKSQARTDTRCVVRVDPLAVDNSTSRNLERVHIDDLQTPHASIFRIPEQLHEAICFRGNHQIPDFPVSDTTHIDSSLAEEATSLLSRRFPFKSAESINKAVKDALAFFTGENSLENADSVHVHSSNGTNHRTTLTWKEMKQGIAKSELQTDPAEQEES